MTRTCGTTESLYVAAGCAQGVRTVAEGGAKGAAIELKGVTKRFVSPSGKSFTALRDLDLVVEAGEFTAVVAPAGCGTSTPPALISGLDPPSLGTVRVFGEPVKSVGRSVGYVFQRDA